MPAQLLPAWLRRQIAALARQAPAAAAPAPLVRCEPLEARQMLTVTTLVPAADTYVTSQASTTNYGSSVELLAKVNGTPRETYVRFDLPTAAAAAARYNSAKLRLYGRSMSGPATHLGAFAIANTSWAEAAPTYNARLATGVKPLDLEAVAGTAYAWYEWDVTPYLNAERAAGRAAVSLAVKGTLDSDGPYQFNSREAAGGNGPRLVLDDAGPPTVPTDVRVTAATGSSVSLAWADQAVDEQGYTVERRPAGGATGWVTIGSPAANQTAFTDASIAAGAGYAYRVRAHNAAGTSAASDEASVTTPAAGSAVVVPPLADAHVRSDQAAANLGSNLDLELKSNAPTRVAFLKFDLAAAAAAGGSVASAKLRLHGAAWSAASVDVQALAVADTGWGELGVTWANQPAAGATPLATVTVTGTARQWYELDLTAHVNAELAAGRTVATVALKIPVASDVGTSFSSRDAYAWANRPQLAMGLTASPPPASSVVKLAGTVIGTAGSYNNSASTRDKAFDGDLNTFFDAPVETGAWVGLDLGSARTVAEVRFAPRGSYPGRMVGGKFQASGTPDFSSGVVDLHAVAAAPAAGELTTVAVAGGGAYRYVRYLSPANGWGNVAEVEFWGAAGAAAGQPPAVAATPGALQYAENAGPVAVDPGVAVSDADSASLTGATVALTAGYVGGQDVLAVAAQNGITGSFNATTGVLTLGGTATVAQYQAALRSVTYTNTSDAPNTAARTVTFTANDGTGTGSAGRTINVIAANDAPVVSANAGLTVAEGGTGTIGSGNLSLSDPDNAPAQLTYTLGMAPAGGTLRKGGVAMGAGSTFTQADVAGNLITYAHGGGETAADSFTFTASDGAGGTVGLTTFAVAVTGVNDAPVVTTTGSPLPYAENAAATAVDPGVTVADADGADLTGATVRITGNHQNGQDVLAFASQLGIAGSWDAATGTLTLTGTAAVASYQAALRSVTYANTSDNPNTAARTVAFTVTDAAGLASAPATRAVAVAAVDDAPTLSGIEAAPLAYAVGDGAVAVTSTLAVADVDSPNLATATVRISGGYDAGHDVLALPATPGVTATWDASAATLTLTGPAAAAAFQAALRSVTFANGSAAPSAAPRTVAFAVHDGTSPSNEAARGIQVAGQALHVSASGPATVAEGAAYALSLSVTGAAAGTVSGWSIDWGDGSPATTLGPGASQTATHAFADGPAARVVQATATVDGTPRPANAVAVDVTDVAPGVVVGGATGVDEGSTYQLTWSLTDPGADTITAWTVDWGDGVVQTLHDGGLRAAQHVYADGHAARQVTVAATDEDGAHPAATGPLVQVANVAPAVAVTGASSVAAGAAYHLSWSATDPGDDAVTAWTVDWGDGSDPDGDGNVGQAVAGSAVSATHVYAAAGTFDIHLQATDEDGTYAATPLTVTVTGAATLPAAPSGLVAYEPTATSVKLTWVDHTTDETGFRVYASRNGGAFQLLDGVTVGPNN
ncbi:MAG TPA: DNRLRE domain-containing protein, partial [Tepidisphaeraceae bacterium]|nr:DNRLRE domain-containing protein [Tepidisphaeraceae bacterium]